MVEKLSQDQFKNVLRDTVLVSLDLLIFNERGEILVGRRKNAPAQGSIFVPGGRVLKGEYLASALKRISKQEIGLELVPSQLTFQGVYNHIYEDSFFSDTNITTQYVAIAARILLNSDGVIMSDEQHESLQFRTIDRLLADPETHPCTRAYFVPNPFNLFLGPGWPG